MSNKDNIAISMSVVQKIVYEIIQDNKKLFINKTYLTIKNDKAIKITKQDNNLIINLDIQANTLKDIDQASLTIQKDIKTMIEHITYYNVDSVNLNIIKLEK